MDYRRRVQHRCWKGLAIGLVVVAQAVAWAAIPYVINYQGRLTNSTGDAITGSVSLTFRLYDASTGGTEKWKESHSVSLAASDNGIFNVVLGNSTALTDIDFNNKLWLSVQVGSDSEMTPRQQLTAMGYALNSDKLDALDSTSFMRTDADTSTSGKVTITKSGAALLVKPSTDPAASTKLLDIQNAAGTSKFSADLEGDVAIVGDLAVTGTISGATSTTGTTSATWTIGTGTDATATDTAVRFGQTTGQESFLFDGDSTDDFILSDDLRLSAQGDLRFEDSSGGEYVALQAPATVSSSLTWTLPSADGSANQLLSTDGSGTLAWLSAGSSGVGDITGVTAGTGLTGGGTSGDVTLSIATDGVTAAMIIADAVGTSEIATDGVGAAEIAANAVATSELADFGTLTATSGRILVADGTDFESVAMGGDATIDSTGAVTVSNDSHTHGSTTTTITLDNAFDAGKTIDGATSVANAVQIGDGIKDVLIYTLSSVPTIATDGTSDLTIAPDGSDTNFTGDVTIDTKAYSAGSGGSGAAGGLFVAVDPTSANSDGILFLGRDSDEAGGWGQLRFNSSSDALTWNNSSLVVEGDSPSAFTFGSGASQVSLIYDPDTDSIRFSRGTFSHDFRNRVKNGSFEAFSALEEFHAYDPTFGIDFGAINNTSLGFQGGWANFAPDQWTYVSGDVFQHAPTFFKTGFSATNITATNYSQDFAEGVSAVRLAKVGTDPGKIKQTLTNLKPSTLYSVGVKMRVEANGNSKVDITGEDIATSTTLSTTLTSTDGNQIEVASVSGFPAYGVVLIGSERIGYGGLDSTSTPQRFLRLTRARDGTTAASHAATAAVTVAPFTPLTLTNASATNYKKYEGQFSTDPKASDVTIELSAEAEAVYFDTVQVVAGGTVPEYSPNTVVDTGDQTMYGSLRLGRSSDEKGGILSVDKFVRTRGLELFTDDPGLSGSLGGGAATLGGGGIHPPGPGYNTNGVRSTVELYVDGTYAAGASPWRDYRVKIDVDGATDTFAWDYMDQSTNWAWTVGGAGVAAPATKVGAATLNAGVKVWFSHASNGAVNDTWYFSASNESTAFAGYNSYAQTVNYVAGKTRIYKDADPFSPYFNQMVLQDGTTKVSLKELAKSVSVATSSSIDPVSPGTATYNLSLMTSGNYTGTVSRSYRVEIDGTGVAGTSSDRFKWSRDGGATFAVTGVSITGADQLLENGAYVKLMEKSPDANMTTVTGGTLGNFWTFNVTASKSGGSTVEGTLTLNETTTPTGVSGTGKLYVNSTDNKLYFINAAGTATQLGGGGGGAVNLLANSSMESWSAGASAVPDGWTLSGTGATIAKETTVKKHSASSAKPNTNGVNEAVLSQSIMDVFYLGRQLSVSVWVNAAAASRARVALVDTVAGADERTYSSHHSGAPGWEQLTATRTIRAGATDIKVELRLEAGLAIATYFDGAVAIEGGTAATTFAAKALTDTGNQTLFGDLLLDSPTGGNVALIARRGAAADTAIRWNETSDKWEFTTDGTTYRELAGTTGGWHQEFTASASQTVFTLTAGTYTPGNNELMVFYNGVLQQVGAGNDYAETNSTTITFNTARASGKRVVAINKKGLTAPANMVTLSPSAAVSDNSANASIFINDSGGGNLLQLQAGAADKFTVSNTGAVTIAEGALADASIVSTDIKDGTIVDADIFATAGIVDTKLATISTAGKVADTALSATVTKLGGTIESAEITDGQIVFADWASNSCTTNQIPKWNGTAWACAADTGGIAAGDSPTWTGAHTYAPTTNISSVLIKQTTAASPTADIFRVANSGNTASFLNVNASGNVVPGANNTGSLGTDALRWASIYGVSIYSGDVILENQFRITEGDKVGEEADSVVFVNADDEKIMKLDAKGNLWIKGEIRTGY